MTTLLKTTRSIDGLLRWKRPLHHCFSSSSSSGLLFSETMHKPSSAIFPRKKNTNKKQRLPAGNIVGDHMKAAGERVAQSNWIQIDGIPPTSSLEAMMEGVQLALERENSRGIVDLDAPWDPIDPIPSLHFSSDSWIQKAHLNLSMLARPTGWFLQLENRSLVQAVLNQSSGLFCSWKKVIVSEHRDTKRPFYHVSDATIRVENCPLKTTVMNVMNLFSRYDLRPGGKAVEEWKGGRDDRPMTFLVHFADASWARSALREKQGEFMDDNKLVLAPYPRQIV